MSGDFITRAQVSRYHADFFSFRIQASHYIKEAMEQMEDEEDEEDPDSMVA